MIVGGIVADFHAAIGDLPLQFGIAVQGCDEPSNLLMPLLRVSIGQPISDQKLFHALLQVAPAMSPAASLVFWRRLLASEDRGIAHGEFVKAHWSPAENLLRHGPNLRLLAVAAFGKEF